MVSDMQVEQAYMSDHAELLAASMAWLDQMDFGRVASFYETSGVSKRWHELLNNPGNHDAVLIRDNGKIIGSCGVSYRTEHNWHSGTLQAYEMVWNANPDMSLIKRGRVMILLIDEIISRWKKRGGVALHIACDPRPEFIAVRNLLAKRGFILSTQMMVLKGV